MADSHNEANTLDTLSVSWEEAFTDPHFFNQTNFCFLVHCPARPELNVFMFQQPTEIQQLQQEGRVRTERYDLLKHPERVSVKPVISCSVISREPNGLVVLNTFSAFGLILDAPFDCVVEMYPAGGETDYTRTHGDVDSKQDASALMRIEELLSRSRRDLNEVVVRGMLKSSEDEATANTMHTRVIGFFAKYVGDYPLDKKNALLMEEHAKRLGLPFIRIQEILPPETPISLVYVPRTAAFAGINFNFEGKDFILRTTEIVRLNGIQFGVIDENGNQLERPMTEEEFQLCKAIIERDLTPSQREDAKKFLEEIDSLFYAQQEKKSF